MQGKVMLTWAWCLASGLVVRQRRLNARPEGRFNVTCAQMKKSNEGAFEEIYVALTQPAPV